MADEDDYYEPRFSNGSKSCLLPVFSRNNDRPRKNLSYNKLPPAPLTLTVLKLDGSSFGIMVSKTGKVVELKQAVEAAFRHFPKKGPGKISWAHVWGQFCLSYDGQKLLDDSDYIVMHGIQDGDQLQFIHHSSSDYNIVRNKLIEEDSDSDPDEPNAFEVNGTTYSTYGHSHHYCR